MRTISFLGLIVSLLNGAWMLSSSFAGEPTKDLLAHYVAIQKALAADDSSQAISEAKALKAKVGAEKSANIKNIGDTAKALSSAKSLNDARKHFKKLSEPFVDWIKKNEDSDYNVIYCPMAGASWVQEKGEILNPYLGKQMLSCGEKRS